MAMTHLFCHDLSCRHMLHLLHTPAVPLTQLLQLLQVLIPQIILRLRVHVQLRQFLRQIIVIPRPRRGQCTRRRRRTRRGRRHGQKLVLVRRCRRLDLGRGEFHGRRPPSTVRRGWVARRHGLGGLLLRLRLRRGRGRLRCGLGRLRYIELERLEVAFLAHNGRRHLLGSALPVSSDALESGGHQGSRLRSLRRGTGEGLKPTGRRSLRQVKTACGWPTSHNALPVGKRSLTATL